MEYGIVSYTDAEGNSLSEILGLYKGEVSFDQVDYTKNEFALKGVELGIRKNPLVGKKGEVDKYRAALKKKLSAAMDYCPGSVLDKLHEYPITDMPRWRRKRLLNLLANMGEDGIAVFVSFDLNDAAHSQLEQFNEEQDLAMMVENKYDPELDDSK
ncbi:hypothetical protein [Fibrobacter sp. UWB7]|uniref:hypothetical protein n=1 Tax=Fibrobacter sp. UWB7 TaxID=1896206 RepID=UPI000933E7A2|nr:hypothetical protein [Fibrobacter sp. UWB7]